jgi:hypothetical protein
MDKALFRAKARRILRRWPSETWEEFVGPIFNRGQMLTVLAGIIGTALLIQSGDDERMAADFSAWELSIQAFAYVLLFWAVISAIRAPMIIVSKDRALGAWHGSRFVYHEPHLVVTLRCKATGDAQFHRFKLGHVEPNAFVEYTIELEHELPREYISAIVVGVALLSHYQTPGQGISQGGTRIGADRTAQLLVAMRPDVRSQTVRVYCRNFTIGNPDDKDGSLGISRKSIRKIA